jgi:hypothetical protein
VIKSRIPQRTGRFFKGQIHPLVVERAYVATTACMVQDFFSKIIIPGYSQRYTLQLARWTRLLAELFPAVDNLVVKGKFDSWR